MLVIAGEGPGVNVLSVMAMAGVSFQNQPHISHSCFKCTIQFITSSNAVDLREASFSSSNSKVLKFYKV